MNVASLSLNIIEHTICAGLLYLCHDGWMDQEMPIPTVHVDILANFLVPETNL